MNDFDCDYLALAEDVYARLEAAEEAEDQLKVEALRAIWTYLVSQAAAANSIIY